MKFNNFKFLVLALGSAAVAFALPLTPLTSTNSSVLVNNTVAIAGTNFNNSGNAANAGQLYSLTAFGFQVYDVGDAVHDSGAMLGTNTGSFSSNYIGGSGMQAPSANFSTTSAANVAGLVTTSGIFSGVFGNVAWTKTYRFVQNNVLEEVYTVQNNGSSAVTNFRGFAAYDPDQIPGPGPGGVSFSSANSAGSLSGFNYAQSAFPGLNVVLASRNAAVSVGFLQNNYVTADCINALLGNGVSGTCSNALVNGTVADRAFAYAFNIASLAVGASQSFTVYQLNGNSTFNLASSLAALPGSGSSSSGGDTGVPEPGSLLLMGSACVALGVIARRRNQK